MSLRATSYALELTHAPDGYQLNSKDGMVLVVLADCHHPERETVWPSIPTITAKAKCKSESEAKETIRRLEQHLVIERVHPDNQGRGQHNSYILLDLDAPTRLRWKMASLGLLDDEQKGGDIRPLSQSDLVSEKRRLDAGLEPLDVSRKGSGRGRNSDEKGSGRGREGVGIANRYKEEPRTGNRIEPGTGEMPPEGLHPLNYADWFLEELGVPHTRNYSAMKELAASAIEIISRTDQVGMHIAALDMRDRAKADRLNGDAINRFWFEDQKFLQPKTATSTNPKSSAPPVFDREKFLKEIK